MTEQRVPTRSSETERLLEEEAQATQEWARDGKEFHLPPAIKPRGTTLASVEAAVKENLK